MAVSASDMAKWFWLQLAHGRLLGRGRLFSEAAHDEMWEPMVVQPIGATPASLAATQPTTFACALGWEIEDHRGARIVWHGGAVLGFKTVVVLIPAKQVGFSIEINSEDGELVRGLMFELLDHFFGLPKIN